MSVFVDEARWKYGRMKMCHMFADSRIELEEMAINLELNKKWFHRDHYNICKSKRVEALSLGAISVTSRFLVKRYRSTKERKPAKRIKQQS